MNTSYPTLNFNLGGDIDMLREIVFRFCSDEIVPRAAEIDSSNEFPMDLWRKFGDLGCADLRGGKATLLAAKNKWCSIES